MSTKTLKPGILVSLRTHIAGGVEYSRQDLSPPEAPAGADARRWETTRIIDDPGEWEAAKKIRAKCQSLIRGTCIFSDFGLLCPTSREPELEAAIVEAQKIAGEFNGDTSRRMRVEVYVLKGRIADSDQEAARAIAAEVRGLLEGMDRGITDCDPKAIRDAAARAKRLGSMLDEGAAAKVTAAVEQARTAAREIVKRVQKSGELVEKVVSDLKRDDISSARFAFLDFDAGERKGEALPAVELGRTAGLDFGTEGCAEPAAPEQAAEKPKKPRKRTAAAVVRELELDAEKGA